MQSVAAIQQSAADDYAKTRPAGEATGQRVLRLICASEATQKDSPYNTLETIRSQSLAFNAARDVHSALLYLSGWYLHWLEGSEEDVMAVVARTARDKRHARLRVLHYGFGPRLLSDVWSMGMIQPRERHSEIRLRVDQLRANLMRGTQFAPLSVWRRVSMPALWPGKVQNPLESPPVRIMLSSALPHQAHSFVSWLAERSATSVVEHRYAGHNTPDLGLTYVDCMRQDTSFRVVAAARHCMHIGLSKIMHSDFSHWVCVFSGDTQRDDELVMRVVQAFAGNDTRPHVIGVAPLDATHTRASSQLLSHGFDYAPAAQTTPSGNMTLLQVITRCVDEPRKRSTSGWPLGH